MSNNPPVCPAFGEKPHTSDQAPALVRVKSDEARCPECGYIETSSDDFANMPEFAALPVTPLIEE